MCASYRKSSRTLALCTAAVFIVEREMPQRQCGDERELSAGRPAEGFSYLAELESKCGEDYAAHQSGHWLSDRDGFHARVDGRVYSARPVRGRAHSFGCRDVSTVRRRIS
jgi:hypothetical protein